MNRKTITEFIEVAIYLRKSREEDEETREETLARHERMLLDYCNRNNLIVKKIYKEVVSGESIENRPQMQSLLDDVSMGLYEGVVCIEIERLSRGNQIDQVEILEVFKKTKTKIFTLNKIYDLSDDNEIDEEYFEFGLFMSRREYKMIKRRLMRGRKQAQKEGYFIGAVVPFGYTKKRIGRGFVLVEDENAEIVRAIFNKYVYENNSIADLRKYLSSLNVKNEYFKNDVWTNKRISRILTNKVYIGYVNANTHNDKTEFKGKHNPIIDEATFELAQQKKKIASVKVKQSTELKNPLASLLYCSCCNRVMVLNKDTSKKSVIYYYTCPHKHIGKCKNVIAREYAVEKKFIMELEKELHNFNYFIDNFGEEIKAKKSDIEKEKKLIQNGISKKEKMITRCCEMLEEGIYSKEKYLERINILEAELNALKGQFEALNKANVNTEEERAYKTIPILENVLKEYWHLTPKQKNDLLKTFVEKIEYTKTKRDSPSKISNANLDLIDLKIYLKI